MPVVGTAGESASARFAEESQAFDSRVGAHRKQSGFCKAEKRSGAFDPPVGTQGKKLGVCNWVGGAMSGQEASLFQPVAQPDPDHAGHIAWRFLELMGGVLRAG